MKKARKGFTLVELLIVVAIMGILSVSMMMAGSKGTKKAEVAKVATGISTIGNAVQLFISVSGDSDLLVLREFKKIPIITVNKFFDAHPEYEVTEA